MPCAQQVQDAILFRDTALSLNLFISVMQKLKAQFEIVRYCSLDIPLYIDIVREILVQDP